MRQRVMPIQTPANARLDFLEFFFASGRNDLGSTFT
jgi:hypothetical protein